MPIARRWWMNCASGLPRSMPQKTRRRGGELKIDEKSDVFGVVVQSGIDPRQFSGLTLEMLKSLNAVEVLPELLKLEEQYHKLVMAAQADKDFKLPKLELYGCINLQPMKDTPSEQDRKIMLFQLRQRELLSLMMQLLRGQRYQPLLDTDLEKTYEAALRARARESDLKDIKTPADAEAKNKGWVHFDPIYNIPAGYMHDYPSIDYSEKLRNQVRGLVEQFTKTVPRDQWKLDND